MYIITLILLTLLLYALTGADLVAGSLIKNLGGTLALCGGYIAGRQSLVAAAAVHLSAPGVEGGATLNQYRTMFQVRILSTLMYS